jgi:hypothetical protein
MAHFAKLGANGKVIQVLTMDNDKMLNADGNEDEAVGQQWLEHITTGLHKCGFKHLTIHLTIHIHLVIIQKHLEETTQV